MATAIHKMEPLTGLALRGFDDRGAGAALHAVTADSFKVSGIHRDVADFTVLMLFEADCFFEHPRIKHLPSFDFSGIVLEFDVHYDGGLMPFDSAKNATVAWNVLSVIQEDGTARTINLFANSSYLSGTYAKATVVFTVATPLSVAYDRVTLWFNNLAFDYLVDPFGAPDYQPGKTAAQIASVLAAQINAYAWSPGDQEIEAVAVGADVTISASKAGYDGNRIRLYAQSKNANLTLLSGGLDYGQMTGGVSDAVWRCTLDFDAIWAANPTWGSPSIRKLWFTYAPLLPDAAVFDDVVGKEFVATYTNWTVTGANKVLQVAGPGSVRVEDSDAWCTYSGSSWGLESGFYSRGFARRATAAGDKVTVKYWCQHTHDVYVGTSLYSDRGAWTCTLDGDASTTLACQLGTPLDPAVVTRRRIRTSVPAGEHTVVLEADGTGPVYFDFLEAAVPSDAPDPDIVFTDRAPACDYGTDHTYKRSPARLMWAHDQMGWSGPLNVYVSVFWWNQRQLVGRVYPDATIDFTQVAWATDDSSFLDIGGLVLGKSVFPPDDAVSIARHFAFFINQTAVGVWAEHDGAGLLTIHAHAVNSDYEFPVSATKVGPGPSFAVTDLLVGGSLETGGVYGKWYVDPSQTPALNRGAREWVADLCAECAARGRELTLAYSMELLNPPDNPPTDVWSARYASGFGGGEVTTATGFASNVTTHCTFSDKVLAYQKDVFLDTAGLMDAAGLDIRLQVGEFLWWFFPGTGPFGAKGMAFYDDYTTAAAATALGRPLASFTTAVDDPAVNGGADVAFLQQQLHDYIAAIAAHVKATYPAALLEILLPYDVNYPVRAGANNLGGRLIHAVNMPPAWKVPATAPFDLVKMEALDWQVGARNQNYAVETMRWPYTGGGTWPRSKVRFLVGLFNGGAPWVRAHDRGFAEGLIVNYWATDHCELFGLDLGETLTPSTPES